MIAGIVLAGGLSRRMGGGDKALLQLAGRPMLAHVLDALRPQVAALAVNANGDAARFAAFAVPVLPDGLPGWPGPLAGVVAGLEWAAALGATALITAPTDCPLLPPDLVPRLLAAAIDGYACAATPNQRHPVVALWPTAAATGLRTAIEAGLRRADDAAPAKGIALWEGPDPFVNVNTPEDLAALAARLA